MFILEGDKMKLFRKLYVIKEAITDFEKKRKNGNCIVILLLIIIIIILLGNCGAALLL